MSASIIPLPTAGREPVRQHKRRGRYPKGVVSIRARERRRDVEQQSAANGSAYNAEFEAGLAEGRLLVRVARDPLLLQKFLPAWERLSQSQRDLIVKVTCDYAAYYNGEQS